MNFFKVSDFPVPASPDKNTFSPSLVFPMGPWAELSMAKEMK